MIHPRSALVTIIVPGRDVEDFADEALASLRQQSFDAWHAVLVDDGSRDATGELFANAAAADPRFTVIHHKAARGLGAARNAGLDVVETPLVGFLDADDVMTPHALERMTATLMASGSEIVAAAYVRLRPVEASDSRYVPGVVQPWVSAATAPERHGTNLAAHPAVSGNIVAWSKLSRTELWQREGLRFPEGKLYEDQIVAQQLYTRARGIDTIPDVVVHWRERADGSSITQRTAELPVLADYLDALAAGLSVLDEAGFPAAAQERVRLILEMDMPPLVRLAEVHPDDRYRKRLGAFIHSASERAEADNAVLTTNARTVVDTALAW